MTEKGFYRKESHRKPKDNCDIASTQTFKHVVAKTVAAGLVKGSPLMPFLQWFGRANVLFGVLHHVPEVIYLLVKTLQWEQECQDHTCIPGHFK